MTHHRNFWLALMAGCIAVYVAAIVHVALGHPSHRSVWLAGLFLGAHLLEIPLAFRQLQGRNAQPARVVLATLLFGVAWWLPARRGLFAVT